MRWIASLILSVTVAAAAGGQAASYDLVVANGRVIDPASGLDAIRHLGITGGRIVAVSETPLRGRRVIDAANHVVRSQGTVTRRLGRRSFGSRLPGILAADRDRTIAIAREDAAAVAAPTSDGRLFAEVLSGRYTGRDARRTHESGQAT